VLRLYLYARVRLYHHLLHTGPRVQQAPGIPCALFSLGETIGKARAKRAAGISTAVVARLDRAIRYSRDASDRADRPRRTGYPACAGYDGGWGETPASAASRRPGMTIQIAPVNPLLTIHPARIAE
jgi:hypothetical protein